MIGLLFHDYRATTSAASSYQTGQYGSSYDKPSPPSYSPSNYGSGSSNWNNGGYDSCVQRKLPTVPASTWLT